MDKVRVCHMTSAHESTDQRIFYKECTSLAAAGYEVYLIAKGESREENGVHVIGLGEAPMSRFKRMTSFSKAVYQKALELNADIYHFHDPELLPYGKKLKRQGKIVIFDSHEDYVLQIREKTYIPQAFRRAIANIYQKYETNVCRMIDAVVFPCLIDEKNPFQGRSKTTCFINNYPILDYGLLDIQYDKTANQIGQIGSLTKERGITQAIQACYLTSTSLLLGGTFEKGYLDELKQIEEFKCVKYCGLIPYCHLADELKKCNCGISLTTDAGQYWKAGNLPTKVYEFMAAGLPTIISAFPHAKAVFEKYHCGICVDPMSVQEIADAIVYLRDNPEDARQMGANGRRAVLEEFNWGTQEEKLLELYAKLQPSSKQFIQTTKERCC